MVLTAVMIGLTALRMARTPDGERGGDDAPLHVPSTRRSAVLVAGVGAAAGLLSGLLGLGGGLVLVPAFHQVLRLPLKATIATSLACVGVLAVPGTVTHALLGDIDWRLALLLAVGVVPGARLGAHLSLRASDRRLRLTVAGFLGLLALGYGVSETVAALT
jgi:uncharacterized protein